VVINTYIWPIMWISGNKKKLLIRNIFNLKRTWKKLANSYQEARIIGKVRLCRYPIKIKETTKGYFLLGTWSRLHRCLACWWSGFFPHVRDAYQLPLEPQSKLSPILICNLLLTWQYESKVSPFQY